MNILAIGAHFDDIELGCGGSLAYHIRRGDTVYMYVATDSGFVGDKGSRKTEDATAEGQAAASILGAKLICGRFKTLHLEFDDDLNFTLVQLIQKLNIDTIYTHWVHDTHHDHIALAKASLHAARHIPRVLMYRSNWYPSYVPFHKNFYVDISDYWDIKEHAIRAHKSEMERTGMVWVDYFYQQACNDGMEAGVKLAESFEVVKWRL